MFSKMTLYYLNLFGLPIKLNISITADVFYGCFLGTL